MPTRKSNVSAVSNEDTPAPKSAPRDDDLGVEDLNLPKSIVQRLAKGVLPANTQIQKDALLAMSKSATVFVNYLTSTAAEHALRSGKKTILPKDVFDAMTELEFEFMLPRLEAEVTKFTSIQADKRNTYRKKVREDKKATSAGAGVAMSTPARATNGDVVMEGADDERAAKRARRESGDVTDEEGDEGEGEGEGDETVDVEDEEVEDDEIEEEVVEEGLTEDPLEEREKGDEDDEMEDGNESD
ncbi:histone-fold-containing protein [Clathrospora elynae]|uniref:DNA polymerase epsilon subunit D n=1 Tax=Clathrospora elynae TaxID=706981 RepID=A0A6A5SXE0_9PLEO|nr:histone-fold-containing protein [Clathrospora elynae]